MSNKEQRKRLKSKTSPYRRYGKVKVFGPETTELADKIRFTLENEMIFRKSMLKKKGGAEWEKRVTEIEGALTALDELERRAMRRKLKSIS